MYVDLTIKLILTHTHTHPPAGNDCDSGQNKVLIHIDLHTKFLGFDVFGVTKVKHSACWYLFLYQCLEETLS